MDVFYLVGYMSPDSCKFSQAYSVNPSPSRATPGLYFSSRVLLQCKLPVTGEYQSMCIQNFVNYFLPQKYIPLGYSQYISESLVHSIDYIIFSIA